MVGYTDGPVDEPFYAYLRAAGTVDEEWYVGELAVEETRHRGYLRLRVSVSFEVPTVLEPGEYELSYCDDPCTGAPLGDLVASPVSIGVDPARRVVREWAVDDPEIPNLDDDALLVGPRFHTTAAQLRAAAGPDPTPPPPPSTQLQPQPAPAPDLPPAAATDDDMAWPLATALVLAGAGATALSFGRRRRGVTPPAAARARAPSAGRG